MSTLYVLIGLPGSGKSTFIAELYPKLACAAYVSRDNIRFSLVKENEPYFSKEQEVKKLFIESINELLEDGYENIFADATHLTITSRRNVVSKTPKFSRKIAIFINTPLETCLQRNNMRAGRLKVPEYTIKEMRERLQKPTINEGFNEIWEVTI